MSLSVTFNNCRDENGTKSLGPGWQVLIDHLGNAAMHGFARKLDAEIAMRALYETGLDWDAPREELERQWKQFGDRKELTKFVAERLQW